MPVPQGDTEKRAHTHSLCSHLPEFLVEEMQEAFTAPRREDEFEQGRGAVKKSKATSQREHAQTKEANGNRRWLGAWESEGISVTENG